MAEITLHAAPILGADLSIGPNRITERSDLALISVAVPLDGAERLAQALHDAWGLTMPTARLSSQATDLRAILSAPDQLLLLFPHDGADAEAHVQSQLKGAGYTTDQTDGWVMLELSGPDTLSALERICPIDLDTSGFPSGAFARTVMEHMGALVLRLEDDRLLLMSASSSAASFLHAVETSYRNVV